MIFSNCGNCVPSEEETLMSHKGSCQILPSGVFALQDVGFPFFPVEHSFLIPFFFVTDFRNVMTSFELSKNNS